MTGAKIFAMAPDKTADKDPSQNRSVHMA